MAKLNSKKMEKICVYKEKNTFSSLYIIYRITYNEFVN